MSVYAAIKSSIHTGALKGNSVLENATTTLEKVVVIMNQNEINYLNAITQAKQMLSKEIISWEEYLEIEDRMAKNIILERPVCIAQ